MENLRCISKVDTTPTFMMCEHNMQLAMRSIHLMNLFIDKYLFYVCNTGDQEMYANDDPLFCIIHGGSKGIQ